MDINLNAVDGYVYAGLEATWTVTQNPEPSIITFIALGDGDLICHAPNTGSFIWPDEISKMAYVDDVAVERTAFSYQQIDDSLLAFTTSVFAFVPID